MHPSILKHANCGQVNRSVHVETYIELNIRCEMVF